MPTAQFVLSVLAQFQDRRLCPIPVPIRQPSGLMGRQFQGHAVPSDVDIRMVISALSQNGHLIHPPHRGSEVGENIRSNQGLPFLDPSRLRFSEDVFHEHQTVRGVFFASSFRTGKFFARFWEQLSNGVPTVSQQTRIQGWQRVVPKTAHNTIRRIWAYLTGFESVVRIVHRPY